MANRNNKHIVKLFYLLTGNSNEFDLKHRLFNISCLSSAFIGLTGTIINIILGLDTITVFTTVFLFVSFIGMYIISYKYKFYKALLPFYIAIIILVLIPLWFTNAGSHGPTAFAFVIVVFIFNIITEKTFRKIVNLIVFVVLASLLLIEYHSPYIVTHYHTDEIRFYDYSFTVMFEMLVMIIISSFFIKSFYQEKSLTEQQRDEIKDKNEEITITQQELLLHKEHLEELVRERTIELEKAKIKAEKSDMLKTAF